VNLRQSAVHGRLLFGAVVRPERCVSHGLRTGAGRSLKTRLAPMR